MARLRRISTVLETARQRLAGLKSITPAPDFGGNLNALGGTRLSERKEPKAKGSRGGTPPTP